MKNFNVPNWSLGKEKIMGLVQNFSIMHQVGPRTLSYFQHVLPRSMQKSAVLKKMKNFNVPNWSLGKEKILGLVQNFSIMHQLGPRTLSYFQHVLCKNQLFWKKWKISMCQIDPWVKRKFWVYYKIFLSCINWALEP